MRRALFWLWRWVAPGLVSFGLIAFLVWRVSPDNLKAALAVLDYPRLVPLTIGFVLILYFWDSLCLRYVYMQGQGVLPYTTVLRIRGASYLVNPLNYELGQAVFAWGMSRAQQTSVRASLAKAVVVSFHDIGILFGLGLLGSLLSEDPVAIRARVICAIGLGSWSLIVLFFWSMPEGWRAALRQTKWAAWTAAWSLGRSLVLAGLRLTHFSFILTFAVIGLGLSEVPLDLGVVLGAIPLVVLFDGLPFSMSGIGTREASLVYLLKPQDEAVVVAFSLAMWSTGQGVCRLLIGAFWWWIRPLFTAHAHVGDPAP